MLTPEAIRDNLKLVSASLVEQISEVFDPMIQAYASAVLPIMETRDTPQPEEDENQGPDENGNDDKHMGFKK